MYIAPSTDVYILKNCPLNIDYQNTIYFENENDQHNYFKSLYKHRFMKLSYVDKIKGSIRVEKKIEDLYDCNYLMYKNENFGNKWFYAFIIDIRYINNVTTEIFFSVDVMQTWMFDYELLPSFVVREHSVNDIIGENTVPEGLEYGEYITTATKSIIASDYRVGILATEQNPNPNTSLDTSFRPPAKVCGYPINCYWWFSIKEYDDELTVQQVTSILDAYATGGKTDAIIAMFIFPYNMAARNDIVMQSHTGAERVLSKTPRNKKLYTYPYCCQSVVCDGNAVNLHYELFDTQSPTFTLRATWGVNPKVILTPTNYQGYNDDFTHTLTLTGFPLLPYIRDYYQNYIGQNWASLMYGTFKDVFKIAGGIATAVTPTTQSYSVPMHGTGVSQGASMTMPAQYGNIGQGIQMSLEGVDSIISRGVEYYHHSIIPDTFVGGADAGDTMVFSGLKGFHTYCRSIKPEFVERLDNFFDMFGYKTNLLKVPNINSRPHWNFVQTQNCNIKGEMPQADINKIIAIYDKGITFWKNGNEIGDYSLDNRP